MKLKVILMAVLSIFAVSSMYALDANKPNEFKIGVGGWKKTGISKSSVNGARVLKKSQKGYSINLGYEYLKADAMYGALDFDFRGNKGKKTKTDLKHRSDLLYNAQLRLGYAFGSSDDFAITPYVGIGASSSELEFMGGSDYYLVRKSFFWTVGMRLDGSINENWDLGIRAQVMPMLSKPKLYTSEAGVSYDKMKKKINYSVDVPITYNFSNSGSALRLTPFFESQNMGLSDAEKAAGHSSDLLKSSLFGARLEYVYKF